MSANINVVGRLGRNAEIKTSKNGKEFVSFTVATDEYRNGKTETAWFNVVSYNEREKKLAQYLSTGRLIQVNGIETVGVYLNKQGMPQASRDIIADRIDLINSGKDSSQSVHDHTESSGTELKIDCGVLKKPELEAPPKLENVQVSSLDDDDLPF